MRGLTARFMVAGVLCATLALATPVAAFADSTTTTVATITTPSNGNWASAEGSYLAKRHSIRVTYRNTVNEARNAFSAAMSSARTGKARNAARSALLNAIASADNYQTAALSRIGNGPVVSGELDSSEYLLERQAINQDYADSVDAETATYRAEVAAATNSAQLVTARANLRLAIAQATMARSAALVTLGARPPKNQSNPGTNPVPAHVKINN